MLQNEIPLPSMTLPRLHTRQHQNKRNNHNDGQHEETRENAGADRILTITWGEIWSVGARLLFDIIIVNFSEVLEGWK